MRVYVILPAAGLGTRMAPAHAAGQPPGTDGQPAPKQFLSVGGKPILVRTLEAFLAVARVHAIYVAVKPQETERVQQQIDDAAFAEAERIHVVLGGDTRQESVARALDEVGRQNSGAEDDVVLVHDAVRPFIEPITIDRTIDAVVRHGAAIVGMPAVDTIKQVERTADGALISSTIPRERVVHAQTPQGARFGVLRRAFDDALADEFQGTDEASLLERAGIPVVVVPGSARNFKVTQPGDLELAEFYLDLGLGTGARQA